MIRFRCEKAGIQNPFSHDAVERIYNFTNGIPREVLKVCDFAYVLSLQAGEPTVPLEAVDLAISEVSLNDNDNDNDNEQHEEHEVE